jgi:membrane protein required for colicin V production
MPLFAMTALDWVIVGILVISLLTAAMNGFFVEVFSIAGLIAGLVIAGMYYMQLEPWMYRLVHSVPGAEAASFLLIAVGVLIVAGIVGRVLRSIVRKVGLGWADRLLGLVFGAVKGCVLVTIVAMAVAAFFPEQPWVRQSQLLPYFVGAAHGGSEIVPSLLGERIRHGVRVFRKESPAAPSAGGIVTF